MNHRACCFNPLLFGAKVNRFLTEISQLGSFGGEATDHHTPVALPLLECIPLLQQSFA